MQRFGSSPIVTERLSLAPLRVEDADEMAVVLSDERLHEFIGGQPATPTELRSRYAKLAAGSSDPDEVWLAGLQPTDDYADGEQVWRVPESRRSANSEPAAVARSRRRKPTRARR